MNTLILAIRERTELVQTDGNKRE